MTVVLTKQMSVSKKKSSLLVWKKTNPTWEGDANLRSVKSGFVGGGGTPPPKKKTPKCFFFCYQLAQTPFCFVRVESHFKNEGLFRFGPPHFDGHNFSQFLVHFLVKAPLRRRHYAPPVSRTAGGVIKGTPAGEPQVYTF